MLEYHSIGAPLRFLGAIVCRPKVPDLILQCYEEDEDVKAVVVPEPGTTIDPVRLHAYCKKEMARFMVPRFIEIREELPYSNIRKVEKEKLSANLENVWDAEEN